MKNFNNLGSNDGIDVVAIDKSISFDKREYLTLDNSQSENATQRRIEYLSNDKKYILSIDIIYLRKALYNDLLFWEAPLLNNEESNFIEDSSSELLLSYKNILFKVELRGIGTNKADAVELSDRTKELVNFINTNFETSI